jgi:eukaryotic-like serine/threonine-protein kinase
MGWVAEFKKRKVFRVAAGYAVVAYVLLEVTSNVLPALQLPDWTLTFTTVLLILGFPVAVVLAWSYELVRDRGERPVATAVAASGAVRGVVVLPFANMSEGAAQTHFADGLVEDLTTRLQAIEGLPVASRQSAFAYQGRQADARTISRELGCRYVIEGSVRRVGDRLRVTAQLIDAPDDRHLWAERYDRELTDAFALQDEICDHIVKAVEARLRPAAASGADTAAPEPVRSGRRLRRSWFAVPALLGIVAMAALLTWTLQQRQQERWAREQALPQLETLVAQDDFAAAFDLAARIRAVTPNDPRLVALEPSFSHAVQLRSEPQGASVYYRPHGSGESEWRLVGRTPIKDVPAPRGAGLWKLEAPGRATTVFALRNPGAELVPPTAGDRRDIFAGTDLTVPLPALADVPAGMVLVRASTLPISLVSGGAPVDLPAFYIDRFEVTNRHYREFVAAGGYAHAEYWPGLEPALVARFVDTTGRPGPSTWEAGSFPDGQADHPVAGVSWHEAAAYARFRGKELPSAWHWSRAAFSLDEVPHPIAPAVIAASNFSGRGSAPVGQYGGIGPYGTYDMAGNVREWLANASQGGRFIAGGSFSAPGYMYSNIDTADPLDRSAENGLRLMRTVSGGPFAESLRKPIELAKTDYAALQPIDDAAYAVLEQQLQYSVAGLDVRVEPLESPNPLWTREQVTLATGYDGTRFAVQLFLPTGATPPYQVVFLMPHSGFFQVRQPSDQYDPASPEHRLDFILRSGRALAVIAFDGAFERYLPPERRRGTTGSERYRQNLLHWRHELSRTIDSFGQRDDIDGERLAWYGISLGAQAMMPLLAVEERIRVAVLLGGGAFRSSIPDTQQAYNYLPRTRQPVLLLGGRSDVNVNIDAQRRQIELLGAPPEHKQHLLFDAGHAGLPHNEVVRATLEWLDRYLGPVAQAGAK